MGFRPIMESLVSSSGRILHEVSLFDPVKQVIPQWFESLNELGPEAKSLFLFNIKTERECEIMFWSSGPQSYETMRFRYREDYNSIVVEGLCNNCFYMQPRALDIERYLHFSLVRTDQSYVLSRCSHCNDEGMVVLTNL
jgi:hypothetical protein